MPTDDADSLATDAPTDGERLADLASETERRERELEQHARELAADRAYRAPIELRVAALFVLLVTIALGLVAGAFVGLAILSVALGHVVAEWEWSWRGPHRRYVIGGPFGDFVIAAIVGHFASSANRVRKRLLRRPRPREG
jgi:MFS family permease